MSLNVSRLTEAADLDWCASLMASSDPWRRLQRDFDGCRTSLGNSAKETYIIREDETRVGLLALDMNGLLAGYIQSICVDAPMRGRGLGSQILAWAEERIFRDSPNVFMCVSSFNSDAQRLYARLGYQQIAVLSAFFVAEHDELLLRKTRGAWATFQRRRA